MKKLFLLTKTFLALLLLCVGTTAWAQTLNVPFVRSGSDSNETSYGKLIKAYTTEGITLKCYGGTAGTEATAFNGTGDISSTTYHYYQLGGAASALHRYSILVTSTDKITKVSYLICSNSNSAAGVQPVLLGWEGDVSTTVDYYELSSSQSIDNSPGNAKWFTFDFSETGKSLKTVELHRNINANVFTCDETKLAAQGGSTSVRIWAIKVWTEEETNAPTITTQPTSATYETGDDATALTVAATASAGTLTYQWYKNTDGDTTGKVGDQIEGATSATLAAANISTASAGTYYYYCIVTDSNGSTTSNKATITVANAIAPEISYASATNTVSISCEGKGTVYYTTDNSTPTSSSTAYSAPFVLTNSSTVRAVAIKGGNASEVVFAKCKVDHSSTAKAVLGFGSGSWDGDAKEWKSTDGTYKLIASNASEVQYYTVFDGNDGFKINHTCTYTLKISDNIKVTSIKFVGISRGDAVNDATIALDGFTPASGTIEKGTFVKTIEFTPTSELGYGASIDITTGGNQFGGYFEVYGTEYAPSATTYDETTWDFTNWSDATKTDVLANAEKWNQYEKTGSAGLNFGENGRSNINALSNNTLTSTAIISETNGLKFTAGAYGLGLMFNLPSTDIGTYHGSQYIWLYSSSSKIRIDNVTAGSIIEIGVESHKETEARVVTLTNATQTQGATSGDAAKAYQVCKWTVTADGNVTIAPSGKGLHIYYINLKKAVDGVKITPANDWSTYVTTKALDFSKASDGLKAYKATAAAGGKVTLEEVGAVPANTPLMLIGTAGTEYEVPVATSASAPAVNMFQAGDGTTTFNGSTYDYILYTDGLFYKIGSGAVPVGKAYLHCDSDPTGMGARGLRVVIGDDITGVEAVEAVTEAAQKEGKFVINGQLFIFKNGKKYNAAGQIVK